MKYHIFFNFGKRAARISTNTARGDDLLDMSGYSHNTKQDAEKNRSKAKVKVSYFLQLWKAPRKDEHEHMVLHLLFQFCFFKLFSFPPYT